MASGEGVTVSAAGPKRQPRKLAAMLRSQMRNIAPFLTLICLSAFFTVASPSFATLDNVGNILTQVSVTGIIAVGLTFVILCAEIDLSIAGIANVTGIAVAYFTQQETYVNIANIQCPVGPRSCWRCCSVLCSASSTRSGSPSSASPPSS